MHFGLFVCMEGYTKLAHAQQAVHAHKTTCMHTRLCTCMQCCAYGFQAVHMLMPGSAHALWAVCMHQRIFAMCMGYVLCAFERRQVRHKQAVHSHTSLCARLCAYIGRLCACTPG